MPDLSWNGWSTLASIALAVIPAVLKFRAELTRALDVVAELVGLVVLMFGVLLYTYTLPLLQQLQANLPQMSIESPSLAAQQVQVLYTLYPGSIALMVLGGLLALSGVLGRKRTAITKKR